MTRDGTARVERLTPPATDADIDALASLLVDAVNAGAAVSFRAPLTPESAASWWRNTLRNSDRRAVFLVARDAEGIAGTVQMQPAWAPNQPHRGDVAKLIVAARCQRAGVASRLMAAVEADAAREGFTLLVLDTKRGDPAEHLYRKLGWMTAGAIPGYALDADGTPHDTVIFYKQLPRAD